MKTTSPRDFLKFFLIAAAYVLPLSIAINIVFSGGFAFWYDPARDLILATQNLHKLTFIGPTTGIPGIFYGPYWIWLLSIGLLFSQDPRIVIFIALTIPYFILLPVLLWKWRNQFGFVTISSLWLLFILGPGMQYATNPWNPFPAPLLFCLLITLIALSKDTLKIKLKNIDIFLVGLLSGLIINFHISFGLAVAAGVGFYYIIYNAFFSKTKKSRKQIFTDSILLMLLYCFGIFIVFVPFVLFEIRHGFHQIQTAINVFTANGSVVLVRGLSDLQILEQFGNTLANLLKIPLGFAVVLLLVGLGLLYNQKKQEKLQLNTADKKLLLLLVTVTIAMLILYLTSKNPVWGYHFIGVEILFLFLLGFIASKSSFFKFMLTAWVIISLLHQLPTIIQSFTDDRLSSPTLANKEYIVKLIKKDAREKAYEVYAYNPPIYVYDYSYLFSWIAGKDVPFDPGSSPASGDLVYIIAPQKSDINSQNFINYRTPPTLYKTDKTWMIQDGTKIMKQIKVTSSAQISKE